MGMLVPQFLKLKNNLLPFFLWKTVFIRFKTDVNVSQNELVLCLFKLHVKRLMNEAIWRWAGVARFCRSWPQESDFGIRNGSQLTAVALWRASLDNYVQKATIMFGKARSLASGKIAEFLSWLRGFTNLFIRTSFVSKLTNKIIYWN